MKKLFWGLVFFFFFAGLSVVIFTVSQLPGQNDIKALIASKNKSQDLIQKAPKESGKVSGINSKSEEGNQKEEKNLESEDEKIKEKTKEEFIFDLLNEDTQDIRVCENLGKSASLKKNKNFDVELGDIFLEGSREDAFVESFRIPIKAIFKDPKLSILLRELLDVKASSLNQAEKDSFLEKISFYSRITKVSAHLYSQKAEFENLGDHAIHLGVLAKLAHLRPDLAQNDEVRSLCDDIETSIKNKKLFDIKKERGSVLSLIKKAGLKPSDLDFAPDEFIKFNMEVSKKGLTFNLSTNPDQHQSKN